MAGTSSAKTRFALLPDHDETRISQTQLHDLAAPCARALQKSFVPLRGWGMPGARRTRRWSNGAPGPSKQAALATALFAARGALGRLAVVPHTDGVTESRIGLAPSIKERRPWIIMRESTCHWNAQAYALSTRHEATIGRSSLETHGLGDAPR